MRVAIQQVKDGDRPTQACVSAGNTGALMALARYLLKTLDGIDRPAIASRLPNAKGGATTVLDLGANVDCSERAPAAVRRDGHRRWCRRWTASEQPSVGLLNIGEEVIKGSEMIKRAGELLRAAAAAGDLNFHGNVEGNDIFKGTTDIVVCDGFVGNVVLKTSEGLADDARRLPARGIHAQPADQAGRAGWRCRCSAASSSASTTAATTARRCSACAGWCSRATVRPTPSPSSRRWPGRMMRPATTCSTACRTASPTPGPCWPVPAADSRSCRDPRFRMTPIFAASPAPAATCRRAA